MLLFCCNYNCYRHHYYDSTDKNQYLHYNYSSFVFLFLIIMLGIGINNDADNDDKADEPDAMCGLTVRVQTKRAIRG